MNELSRYITLSTLVLVLDLSGTFVFALSGAVLGITRRFDLFGVLVLSYAAANSGGVIRDLLIAAVPQAGIADWRYIAVPILAGLATFYGGAIVERLHDSVQIFDAAGLALFAVSGAQKALNFHLGPLTAIVLGMPTGFGGGVVRDMLAERIPVVLRGRSVAPTRPSEALVAIPRRSSIRERQPRTASPHSSSNPRRQNRQCPRRKRERLTRSDGQPFSTRC